MFSTKIFILLACSLAIALATPVDNSHMPGGARQLTVEEIKQVEKELQLTLNQLATDDGHHYEISKVISATRQVVAGTMTRMNVDLVNSLNGAVNNCNVAIWARPWMPNGIETTIECAGEKTMTESHSA